MTLETGQYISGNGLYGPNSTLVRQLTLREQIEYQVENLKKSGTALTERIERGEALLKTLSDDKGLEGLATFLRTGVI